MRRMTQKGIEALAAQGKIRSHTAGNGPNLADQPPVKGIAPKSAPVSAAKREFINWLRMYCKAKKLPLLEEQVFDESRKWRLDFVIPGPRPIALEYEGVFAEKARHTTLGGYVEDVIKYNAACIAGITVLRYTAGNGTMVLKDLAKILP